MNNFNSLSIKGATILSNFSIKNAVIILSLTFLSSITHAESLSYTDVAVEKNETILLNGWTGFYGGLNIGGIFNNAHLDSHNLAFTHLNETCNKSKTFSSFSPGLQVGYAYQFDTNIVLGVEGDFTYNVNDSGKATCVCEFNPDVSDRFSIKNRLQGSLRGRIGYALLDSRLLPFIAAGGSLANLGLSYDNEGNDYYSDNTTQGGWLVGAGLEWDFSPDWSLRAEYYYTSYGNAINMKIPTIYGLYDPHGEANVNLHVNSLRVAINYWI